MKKIITILLMFILMINIASAVCTVAFDKSEYNPTETIEARLLCDKATEKSQVYTLTWSNGTSTLETDFGVTPSTIGIYFFETYQILSSTFNQTITATLTGTNLEGSDSANITDIIGNKLIINDCKFKPKSFIGSDFSVDCEVKNILNKVIDNAHCVVYATNIDGAPLQISEYTSNSIDGRFVSSGTLKPENLLEDTSYLADISCHCESGDNACWDQDGLGIENYQGSTSISFTTAKWLEVGIKTDRTSYAGRQVAIVSANVTSIDSVKRLNLENYYKIWCGDNTASLDRVVVSANPNDAPDRRGINPNSTIMQGWALIVPEKRWMQGRINKCFASVEVWVLNEQNEKIKLYTTSSDAFYVTVSDLGVNPDWEISGDNQEILTSQVNMSSDKYNDYHGEGIGSIDLRLDLNTPEYMDAYTDSNIDGIILFDQMLTTQNIQSITTNYCNGSSVEHQLEVTNEGYIEIEVRDVNQSSACIDTVVTLDTYRQDEVLAIQSISNSFLSWLARIFIR